MEKRMEEWRRYEKGPREKWRSLSVLIDMLFIFGEHQEGAVGSALNSGGGILGRTGRMRLPKEESWGTKKPTEFVLAACKA